MRPRRGTISAGPLERWPILVIEPAALDLTDEPEILLGRGHYVPLVQPVEQRGFGDGHGNHLLAIHAPSHHPAPMQRHQTTAASANCSGVIPTPSIPTPLYHPPMWGTGRRSVADRCLLRSTGRCRNYHRHRILYTNRPSSEPRVDVTDRLMFTVVTEGTSFLVELPALDTVDCLLDPVLGRSS